jgi:hypothetical protein
MQTLKTTITEELAAVRQRALATTDPDTLVRAAAQIAELEQLATAIDSYLAKVQP